MPRKVKDSATHTVESSTIEADEFLICGLSIATDHTSQPVNDDGSATIDGNFNVGDKLTKDADGNYLVRQRVGVRYVALLAGVVVKEDHVVVENDDLVTLMTNNPTARDAIKQAAYDALEVMGIVPADSIIV